MKKPYIIFKGHKIYYTKFFWTQDQKILSYKAYEKSQKFKQSQQAQSLH